MVTRSLRPDLAAEPRVTVILSEEQAADPVEVNPTLTVLARTRTGWTDDGDPQFEWATVVEGVAIVFEDAREVDDAAGIEAASGRAVLLYDGDETIDSTCSVLSSFGARYRVTKTAQIGSRVEIEFVRVRDSDG